ncbi:hypothetical protein J4440_05810 [Candidatus Woesearchaeota archaeon]|nr:hypothetical protein [Candidatus Woesearchaeota archaeon]
MEQNKKLEELTDLNIDKIRELALKYRDFVTKVWPTISQYMCNVTAAHYISKYDPETQKSVGENNGPFANLYLEWIKQRNSDKITDKYRFHREFIEYLPKELIIDVAVNEGVMGLGS